MSEGCYLADEQCMRESKVALELLLLLRAQFRAINMYMNKLHRLGRYDIPRRARSPLEVREQQAFRLEVPQQ